MRPNPWQFVEEFYPDYSSCDEIAYNNNLDAILSGEITEGSSAEKIYQEEREEIRIYWGKTLPDDMLHVETIARIEQLKNASDAEIYKQAIISYLKSR